MCKKKSARFFTILVFALVLVGLVIVGYFHISTAIRPADQNLYPRAGEVVGVFYKADTVVWIDRAGNSWSFTGCDDWEIGDEIVCVMDSMGTDEIYDDAIVKAYYMEPMKTIGK